MLAAVGLLVVGAGLLYVGAEAAIRGATGFARILGIPVFVMGALLFGIDLEGLGTALVAAGQGQTALAAGEIFGTILFLFSAAFGVALLIAPRPVPSPDPVMVLAPAVQLVVAAWFLSDRFVGRLEGGVLVLLYAGYVWLVVREGTSARARARELEREAEEAPRSRALLLAAALAGLGLLYLGARLLVAGGTRILAGTELSAGFVGAAVLGVLASLDEVLLEVIPIRRGTPELATGNLFGTLAAFTSGVLGLAALVHPLDLDSASSLAFLGAAVLYAVVASTFLLRGRVGRVVGAVVLAFYVGWLVVAASV
ncbi:MAG: sodium:calcium antiporter [Actinomycetota bacterium]